MTTMIKINTRELSGAALNYAVALALGWNHIRPEELAYKQNYSTCWNKGGPIIERMKDHGIVIKFWQEQWVVSCDYPMGFYYGSTMLIAGMRCFVAQKLGDEIEIPVVVSSMKDY